MSSEAHVKDLFQLFRCFSQVSLIFAPLLVVKVSCSFSRFKPAIVKEFVHEIVRERLSGVKYEPEKIPETCSSLADCIRDKVKSIGIDKYKIIVQVMIGEQRGQGVKMCSRFFWDADTDNYAEDVFMNDSLFCVAAVFGCYYY
uniref:Dynein light chain Tctex-type 2B n=1 Tax=Oryzias sinensis TaxID=183150 RepID=A0A8C7WPC2_9TELE